MEKEVHLKIERKYHENNGKLRIGGWKNEKKKIVVCKTARRAHSQKTKHSVELRVIQQLLNDSSYKTNAYVYCVMDV